jgi:lipoyl(octanoyl) transferase
LSNSRPPDGAWLLTPGQVPYGAAYAAMHDLAERRAAGEVPDTLILLEHPPVFTAGKRWDPGHLLFDETSLSRMGAELHHVDRGGSVTFHGPGQLVGYPIVHLGPEPDVIAYLRNVEEVIIRACADLGVSAERSEGYTGVWAGKRKLCAIGVRVQRDVTLHGFALNCATDLAWFGAIVPCGIADRGITTLTELTGRTITVEETLPVVARRFEDVFGTTLEPAPRELVAAFASQPPAPAHT